MNLVLRSISLIYLLAWLALGTFRSAGLDYDAYLQEFIDPINNLKSFEVGYVALIQTVGHIGGFWIILLLANLTLLAADLKGITRVVTWYQAVAFTFYLSYVGLFLIYGSPRRLIAFSLISYCLFVLAFHRKKFQMHPWRHAVIAAFAASFHVSALIFIPVLVAYAFGSSLYRSPGRILLILCVMTILGAALYSSGTVDYILIKISYYLFDAVAEQEYLQEVPSVTSGLIKRFIAISLIWFGTSTLPEHRRAVMELCLIEAFIYGTLGSLSPVLAVVSSYFSSAYLIPALLYRRPNDELSLRGLFFLTASAVYFLPTAFGLIRLFGNEYIL